jgi:catechol 2,3-dioxygenase-like lactoylglutathione lyase family enzyme
MLGQSAIFPMRAAFRLRNRLQCQSSVFCIANYSAPGDPPKGGYVEREISRLVAAYEQGELSRRQLIGTLALLAATATTASATDLQGLTINHVSLQVKDLKRSRDFYSKVFGLSVLREGGRDNSIYMGHEKNGVVVLNPVEPGGKVDHFAISVMNFDKDRATQQLKQLGLVPIDEPAGASFHIIDPDGFKVQLI